MTTRPQPVDDATLNAWVDGRLAEGRRLEVEAAFAADTELAQRARAWRAQNDLLREGFDAWLEEPVPARRVDAARPARARRNWLPWAASVAALAVGLSCGWGARDALLSREGVPTTFAREAAFAHAIYSADQRRPVEVAASDAQSLVTWLTRRVGQTAIAPNLSSIGYELVGGRLIAGNARPTALLMYENAAKQRLTLQWRKLAARTEETQFRYDVENGVGVFYWIDDNCAYAISGTVDRRDLLAVAQMVYAQIAVADPGDGKGMRATH